MSPLSSSSRTAARAAVTSMRMRMLMATTNHGVEGRILRRKLAVVVGPSSSSASMPSMTVTTGRHFSSSTSDTTHNIQERQRWRSSSKSGNLDAALTTIRWEDWAEQKDQEEDGRISSNSNSTNNPFLFPPFPSKSPAEDIQALWSTWFAKIPKGFENFYPKNKKKTGSSSSDGESDKDTNGESSSSDGHTEEGSSSSSEASESPSSHKKIDPKHVSFKVKGSGGSGSGDDGGGHKKQGSGPPPPPPEEDPQNIPAMIALLLMVMAARGFFKDEDDIEGGGGEGEGGPNRGGRGRNGREITFVDFRNYLLDQGQVEKIVVVNNNLARIILHPGSKGLPANIQHGVVVPTDVVMDGTASVQSKMHQHDGEPDSTVLEFNRPTDGSSSDGSSSGSTVAASLGSLTGGVGGASSDSIHNTRHHPNTPVYHFYIGSIESFEEKLSKAQSDIHPREWVPVQYVNEVNLMVEFIKATPMLALVAMLYYYSRGFMGSMGSGAGGGAGGMGSMFQVGKSNAKKINPESVKVNFGDVAGCQQAKQEVMEFVQFLSSPEQFTKLGAKIPKGALLCGPPGTGKTLLAKAVAGEAGVPFYSISGSDFIEMFVGVGPSRVRDLFKEARNNSPCIIFIDEIDAVGRQRGRGGFSGGNDERENTLNQLLVEMDGFNPTTGVVVLAGTNRVDILDQALTRPGRFDRQITVDRPDLQGRKEIFNVHLKGLKLEADQEDISGRLAGLTPGFAGADIANLTNEAAIVAARRKGDSVTIDDFEKATDRVIGGLESNKIMSVHEKEIVAYHEAGHAVAGWFLEHADPLLKVTIIPRASGALGYAQYLPKETFLRTQEQILDIVCKALAGRAAEDVVFGRVTTGASDDLKRVTQLVYSMIQTYGMNSRVGQLAYPKNDDGMPGDKPYSDSTAEAMDDEARAIVDAAYARTVELIKEHREDLEKVAQLLLEKETITHDDMVDTIGARPFTPDGIYEEYVSSRAKQNGEPEKDGENEAPAEDKQPEEETG
eukprot:CAMPEP_0113501766 /NCGR_PEP_ID=MMETSP0014_2-20120614/33146_1 /TAXON_ID=2857 /ORGANISM="Nitzschia sp." /LENGTH=1005 /DNA_ID=CAMNT_0000396409 /DNA_START=118 /DNA_END=3132 /DNA_ORIENTATION=- /assembly_acc=CAM_ASM_000159